MIESLISDQKDTLYRDRLIELTEILKHIN
jgi:hypothetical protein